MVFVLQEVVVLAGWQRDPTGLRIHARNIFPMTEFHYNRKLDVRKDREGGVFPAWPPKGRREMGQMRGALALPSFAMLCAVLQAIWEVR